MNTKKIWLGALCLAASPLHALDINPEIGVVLNAKYQSFSHDPDEYYMPGFTLGDHAGPGEEGFSLDETEINFNANIDDQYFGNLTLVLHEHDGHTEVELEEAFVQTTALPFGFTATGGRFLSEIGYLNSVHAHDWDFADQPLVYRAMLNDHYYDDGARLSWVAPTDLFIELGGELLRGGQFPAEGASHGGVGARSLFAKIGSDFGVSHSWQLGVSQLWAYPEDRYGGGHDHDHGHDHHDHVHGFHDDEHGVEPSYFTGDSFLTIVDLVWKWAPDGNPTERNLTLQTEYFYRTEDGTVSVPHGDHDHTSSYKGTQQGWYAQAVYQFIPRWRAGVRFDWLTADNRGDEPDVLEEAGLLPDNQNPTRYSAMIDYSHSEFSRLRLQYNHDCSSPTRNNQLILQYIMSFGAHGAHRF